MPGLILAVCLSLLGPLSTSTGVPEGTTQYEVRYKWGVLDTRVANGQIIISKDEWNGQTAMHTVFSLRATPFFRLFMAEDYWMELFVSPDGTLPLSSHSPIRAKGKECDFDVLYKQKERVAESHTVSAKESVHRTFSLDDGAMDLLALFHYMQNLDISRMDKGQSISLQVIMPRSVAPVLLHYEGMDSVPFSEEPCHLFLMQFTGRGVMENKSGNTVHLWMSTGPDRQLIMLTIPLNNGLMIARIKR